MTVLPNSSSGLSKASKQTWPSFYPSEPGFQRSFLAVQGIMLIGL